MCGQVRLDAVKCNGHVLEVPKAKRQRIERGVHRHRVVAGESQGDGIDTARLSSNTSQGCGMGLVSRQ